MTQEAREGHLERTAHEPRHASLHRVQLQSINQINDDVRIYRLGIPDRGHVGFLPGQWVDLFVNTVPKPGGFSITSSPSQSLRDHGAYLELAIQRSPDNPAAAWLWRPECDIIGTELHVRIGGSFVWHPELLEDRTVRKVVLVAGGMGINPIMSMLSWHFEQTGNSSVDVELLYSMKTPSDVTIDLQRMLFLERIMSLNRGGIHGHRLRVFLTGSGMSNGAGSLSRQRLQGGFEMTCEFRRMTRDDLAAAVGPDEKAAVVYVCGVPAMTDEFVAYLTSEDGLGMDPGRVLFEKWW